jgi:predicted Zn-dependent protease with MMP-like domain
MRPPERARFDALLEEVLAALPPRLLRLLDEAPLVVDDRPPRELLRQLGMDPADEDLCGLHTGTPLTLRSVEHAHDLPETVHLFREGIVEEAGGWREWEDEEGNRGGGADAVRREIRITLLHELGHHFGLEEDDLEGLGYG